MEEMVIQRYPDRNFTDCLIKPHIQFQGLELYGREQTEALRKADPTQRDLVRATPDYIVELEDSWWNYRHKDAQPTWICEWLHCDAHNNGWKKRCVACGAPRPPRQFIKAVLMTQYPMQNYVVLPE